MGKLNQIKDFDSIIKYPKDTGCTGQAIVNREIVFFNKDNKSNFFVSDIDNISNIAQVESIIICPIYSDDQLLGTVQLINKLHGQRISADDVTELSALIPALATIYSTCNDVREIDNIGGAI